MATKEQISALFKFRESKDFLVADEYRLIGREDDFSILVTDPVGQQADGSEGPSRYVVSTHAKLPSGATEIRRVGSSLSLEAAQRACLKLAGIDPDAEPAVLPGAGL